MPSLEKHFNFSKTAFINRKLLCQKEFQRALFNINIVIETKAAHLCYGKKNETETAPRAVISLCSKVFMRGCKKVLQEPVISPGFLCFKAEDAKPATTSEETAAAGRVCKTEWNFPGTFPPLISPVTHYQTADYSKEHRAETQLSMDMLEESQIC